MGRSEQASRHLRDLLGHPVDHPPEAFQASAIALLVEEAPLGAELERLIAGMADTWSEAALRQIQSEVARQRCWDVGVSVLVGTTIRVTLDGGLTSRDAAEILADVPERTGLSAEVVRLIEIAEHHIADERVGFLSIDEDGRFTEALRLAWRSMVSEARTLYS
jgi:hypothetical protein